MAGMAVQIDEPAQAHDVRQIQSFAGAGNRSGLGLGQYGQQYNRLVQITRGDANLIPQVRLGINPAGVDTGYPADKSSAVRNQPFGRAQLTAHRQ